MKMKYLFLTFFSLCLLIGFASAQQGITYDIHPGSEYKVSAIADALDMCDLTKYRKIDSRVKLLFDDDTIVELYSASELLRNKIEVNTDFVNRTERMMLNLFKLHPDGFLIEDASPISKEETIIRLAKLNP